MSEHDHESLIPPLHTEDLFQAELELLLDSDILQQFERIKLHDPKLARALLLAAHHESIDDLHATDMTAALRSHMQIVRAIEKSLLRSRDISRDLPSVDDVGGLQPSGE